MTKIAIVQGRPVPGSLEETLDKSIGYINSAAHNGANIIVFGECWLSGYPAWIDFCSNIANWDHPPMKEAWATVFKNGIEIPGNETATLCDLAKNLSICIVLGANEVVKKGKGNGSIFNALLIINETGELAVHHRKLMPTFNEKLIHGMGDGEGLRGAETSFGILGGLICWEHWMPLARQAMHDTGEHIHFALWPMVKETHHLTARTYAYEGRCYVVSVGQMQNAGDVPSCLELPTHLKNKNEMTLRGGSCVIGPDGNFILEPVYDKEDMLLVDIPGHEELIKHKMELAVSGHYQRPDVFELTINRRRD